MRKRTLAALTAVALILIIVSSAAAADGLLSNGGFDRDEYGNAEPWYFEAWYSDADDQLTEAIDMDGESVMHIVNYIDNDVRMCQRLEVEPETCYKLTCRIKTEGVDSGAGANISVVDSLATSTALLGTNDWQTVELIGVTGEEQTALVVCVRIGGYGQLSYGEAWFDDFTVERLDTEPDDAQVFSAASTGGGESSDSVFPGFSAIIAAPLLSAVILSFVYYKYLRREAAPHPDASRGIYLIPTLCAVAVLVRVALSLKFYGYPYDMGCFMSWADMMVSGGPSEFYVSGAFADYPPGYMYVLWLCGGIAKLFSFETGGDAYALLIKVPAIAADIAAGILVYRFAKKRWSERVGFVLLLVTLFMPVFMFISGGWGQIDQILAYLLVVTALLIIDDRLVVAGAVYGIAILLKPQALMAGPVLAAAYICRIIDSDERMKTLLRTVAAVLAAVAVIVLAALPFGGGQEWTWLLNKYFSTATSYPYASIEAFNLMALFGGNWAPVTAGSFIFSYGTWGTILIILSVAYSLFLYIKGRNRNMSAIILVVALELCAIFTLGQYMHERYLFPVLLFLLIAYASYRDKRLFASFIMLSTALLANSIAAFLVVQYAEVRGTIYDTITLLCSAFEVFSFGFLAYAATDILAFGRVKRLMAAKAETEVDETEPIKPLELKTESRDSFKFRKKDYFFCIVLTAVYAVCALINLGTTQAPETYWTSSRTDEPVTLDLGAEYELDTFLVYGGLYEGDLTLEFDDGSTIVYEQENGDMFRWTDIISQTVTTQYVTMRATYGQIWINGIALYTADGQLLDPSLESYGDESALNLIDERDMIPEEPSYLNGMYFDELYHARTAYEHLNGIHPYENSHPPLGKVFIMLGIAIFGMNALGWRIVGALFGIAMVPLMYALAKRLLKSSEYALLAAGLFAFDFMHFTQTRIATIDTYGVFFILLMFYNMYRYYTMNFYVDGLKATLKPLAFAGLFFGLGMASKWIGAYAGLGLAFMLLITLIRRYEEYAAARFDGDGETKVATADFWRLTVKTLLWCCVFYLAVPIAIYLAAYIPYYLSESHYTVFGDSNSVWGVQKFMYSYHSGLQAEHSFQSAWYEWPLILRPIWYYVKYYASELASTISAMGNPAVWWPGFIMSAVAAVAVFRRKLKLTKQLEVIYIGMAFNFLPWVLITRCTFIYHYFATVPFIILCSVYLLKALEARNPKLKFVKWAWLGLAVVLFAMFYPVISGAPVSVGYIHFLEWLPGWTFLGY